MERPKNRVKRPESGLVKLAGESEGPVRVLSSTLLSCIPLHSTTRRGLEGRGVTSACTPHILTCVSALVLMRWG